MLVIATAPSYSIGTRSPRIAGPNRVTGPDLTIHSIRYLPGCMGA